MNGTGGPAKRSFCPVSGIPGTDGIVLFSLHNIPYGIRLQ